MVCTSKLDDSFLAKKCRGGMSPRSDRTVDPGSSSNRMANGRVFAGGKVLKPKIPDNVAWSGCKRS